jgi:dihydrofolate reductase
MRKIVSGLFVSLDGVYEEPGDWHFPYFDDAMGAAVDAQMRAADTMLLGRVTWEHFAGFWPDKTAADIDIAPYMNDTPKLVVSNTLTDVSAWQNSTLLSGDVYGDLRRLKEQPGKTIAITGSGELTRTLLRDGLLDELRLLVHPIAVGRGKRLFPDGFDQVPLELVESEAFPTGVLSLTYRRAADAPADAAAG